MISRPSYFTRYENPYVLFTVCVAVIIGFTALRAIFACTVELRVDEAYYWTWSKENAISYFDHPPMIAWWVRFGTFIFGDTNLGVRSTGLLAMPLMQLLLADIVWRTVRDFRYVVAVVLLPEAAVDYGLLMAKIGPDTPLIVFALAMVWALVRLALSADLRWWLLVGLFGGLALLSKYTAVLLFPAVLAYVIVPPWRMKHFSSPYFWFSGLIALTLFSPVLYWNAAHDWVSFRFQLDRMPQLDEWSPKFLLDLLGQQFALVGPVLFPVMMMGTSMLAWRGYRAKDPVAILLSTCVLFPLGFFVWQSFSLRIGDSWPLFVWPFGFAAMMSNLKVWRQENPTSPLTWISPSIVSGVILVAAVSLYYLAGSANYLGPHDSIGNEAGFGPLTQTAEQDLKKAGASWFATIDYRTHAILRWHLKDRFPVVQINERIRYLDFITDKTTLNGPIGLLVARKDDPNIKILQQTTAALNTIDDVDLIWRGVRYDTYTLQMLTDWKPVLSPPPGNPFYVRMPH